MLALFRLYQEEGATFIPKFARLLESGGSAAPTGEGRVGPSDRTTTTAATIRKPRTGRFPIGAAAAAAMDVPDLAHG